MYSFRGFFLERIVRVEDSLFAGHVDAVLGDVGHLGVGLAARIAVTVVTVHQAARIARQHGMYGDIHL